jgi:prepilin-type N-terminal cleavage/methylation domain-containing protein
MHCTLKTNGKRQPPRKNSAFTLVEILVALVMALVIFSAAGHALNTGFNTVQVSREQLRANQVCLAHMEGIRLCRWDKTQLFNTDVLPRQFTDYFYPVGLSSSNNPANAFVSYSGTVTLNTNFTLSPNPSYISNLCLVTVSLTWTDRCFSTTKVRSYSMTTLVSKNGIQNYVFSH